MESFEPTLGLIDREDKLVGPGSDGLVLLVRSSAQCRRIEIEFVGAGSGRRSARIRYGRRSPDQRVDDTTHLTLRRRPQPNLGFAPDTPEVRERELVPSPRREEHGFNHVAEGCE